MKKLIFVFLLLYLNFMVFGEKFIDYADKPLKGNFEFKLKKIWEIDSAGNDIIVKIGKITVDKNSDIYISELKQSKIYRFNSDGIFQNSIGKRGEGPGEYKNVYSFFVIDNTVVVSDMGRFHYFDKNGKYIKTINSGKSFLFPKIMLSKHNFIYEKSKSNKDYKTDNLNFFNLETKKSTIITNIETTKINTIKKKKMMISIKFDSNVITEYKDFLYYANGLSKTYKIKRLNLKNKEKLSFGINERKRIKLTDRDKRKKYEKISLNGGKMPKDMIDLLIKNDPDYASFFDKIIVNNGLLYVYVNDNDDKKNKEIFDIFSLDGKYLYRAVCKLPVGMSFVKSPVFKGNTLYVFAEDDEGETELIKYGINLPNN